MFEKKKKKELGQDTNSLLLWASTIQLHYTTDIWLFPDGGGNSNHICVYFTAPIKGRKEK